MAGTDGLGIERNRIRFAVHHFRNGLGIGGIYVQVVARYDEKVVPELLGKILLLMNLGIEALHHLYHGLGLLRALGLVRDILKLLHHLEHVASVLRHLQLFHFCIVIEFDRIIGCFHIDIIFSSQR